MTNTDSNSDNIKAKASDHGIYGVTTIASLLVPIVGIVLGIVYLAKETKLDRKLGEHLIAVGIFSGIIISALWYFYVINQTSSVPVYTSTPVTLTEPTSNQPKWSVDVEYPKITEGMTKEAVEVAINKTAENCSEYEQSAAPETYSTCIYGGESTDTGIIIVNYANDIVTTKEKASF